ncbi:hypothetical protein [Methylocystis sp. SC2]|uniref:hypothetical protein n=1 Tax=Methylocystis sp. (strain SC2) TaxID=187303 RepID=UPI00027AF024|nr:hypothetical protein [Methylocystis sp. SC2]CCJ07076.1 Hypothetical protein BN69_1625 [Methylocystis sp. SC2]
MDDGFEWFATQDRERWLATYCITREGAIHVGRKSFDGAFYIYQARREEIDLRIKSWSLMELLTAINDERVDPDGDGSVFRPAPSEAQLSDLESCVETAIRQWAWKHELAPEAWAFAERRNEELIPDERDYPPDVRARYHALVARMGAPKEARV